MNGNRMLCLPGMAAAWALLCLLPTDTQQVCLAEPPWLAAFAELLFPTALMAKPGAGLLPMLLPLERALSYPALGSIGTMVLVGVPCVLYADRDLGQLT